jgi:hypothetical protein
MLAMDSPRLKSAHSCRNCHRWLEGEWSQAPDGPVGDEQRLQASRQMAQGACDACLPTLLPAHPNGVPADSPEDIRDHRSSAAALMAWLERTPKLQWHYDERHPDLFRPDVETLISALFPQPGGSVAGIQLFCAQDVEGASYEYHALVAVAGDEHPVQIPINRITEQIMVRSMIDQARPSLTHPIPEKGGLGI